MLSLWHWPVEPNTYQFECLPYWACVGFLRQTHFAQTTRCWFFTCCIFRFTMRRRSPECCALSRTPPMQRRSRRSSPSISQRPPLWPSCTRTSLTKLDMWTALLSSSGETCLKWFADLLFPLDFVFLRLCCCHSWRDHNFLLAVACSSWRRCWRSSSVLSVCSWKAGVCEQNNEPVMSHSRLSFYFYLRSVFCCLPALFVCGHLRLSHVFNIQFVVKTALPATTNLASKQNVFTSSGRI